MNKEIKRLFFRADMNETIASGHIMRCLTIAKAATKLGLECGFILADCSAVSAVESEGFKAIVLNTKWDDFDSELPIIEDILSSERIDCLFVDSYYVTDNYLKSVSNHAKTVYLDDLNVSINPADEIVVYDSIWDESEYIKQHPGSRVHYGFMYAPLREEFEDCGKKSISDNAESLLILSGGGDKAHAIKHILQMPFIARFEKVTAICGRLSSDYDSLKEMYRDTSNIEILSGVNNISDYMKAADICISAAGNTIYELCASGVPTIAYALNRTQEKAPQKLELLNAIRYAGTFASEQFDSVLSRLVTELAENKSLRESLSIIAQSTIDGEGAARIIKAITDR